jgi:hypothetical protein
VFIIHIQLKILLNVIIRGLNFYGALKNLEHMAQNLL